MASGWLKVKIIYRKVHIYKLYLGLMILSGFDCSSWKSTVVMEDLTVLMCPVLSGENVGAVSPVATSPWKSVICHLCLLLGSLIPLRDLLGFFLYMCLYLHVYMYVYTYECALIRGQCCPQVLSSGALLRCCPRVLPSGADPRS